MQTRFTEKQLNDPKLAKVEQIIRSCVHCGFCMATCPTYVLTGNELESPRGRIYLIKEMLENDRPATEVEARHLDSCLTCLSCMTTCPSGVHYAHLLAQGRSHIEKTFKRPLKDRLIRSLLVSILPYRTRFKWALRASRLMMPFKGLLPTEFKAMLDLNVSLSRKKLAEVSEPEGQRKYRMGLHGGCVQRTVGEHINIATAEFLSRRGVELITPKAIGCCGAITEHIGKNEAALETAKAYIDGWIEEIERDALDAIVINTSGCGTSIKDYGHMFKDDPDYSDKAKRVSALARDITEVIDQIGLGKVIMDNAPSVAYHPACSLKHGQKIVNLPKRLLMEAGFEVRDIKESHLCCGSAGTYNITQSVMADKLKTRKIKNIEATNANVIASGNIGCNIQIGSGTKIPTVHIIELINWATGGVKPSNL